MARTIQSPGVEINEVDLSLRPVIPTGTSVLIPGFAPQGPTDEVFEVTSLSEFETVYGLPTNAAERYMYHTAKAVFNSDSRVLTTRIPYGSGAGLNVGDSYSALFFPVFFQFMGDNFSSPAVIPNSRAAAARTGIEGASAAQLANGYATDIYSITADVVGNMSLPSIGRSLSGADGGRPAGAGGGNLDFEQTGYFFGKPTLVKLDEAQYNTLQNQDFAWRNYVITNPTFTTTASSWSHAGMVITNKSRATVNDKYEGLYVGVADNSQFNPANDFDSIRYVNSVNENSTDLSLQINGDTAGIGGRLNFPLSGTSTSNDNSISETMENIPTFDISTDEFDDTLVIGVFKLRASVFNQETHKLDYVLSESYFGSLDKYRTIGNIAGGPAQTFHLPTLANNSSNIDVILNPHMNSNGSWIASGGNAYPKHLTRILSQRAAVDATSTNAGGTTANFGMTMASIKALTGNGMELADGLFPLGNFQKSNPELKTIGNVPDKLNRVMRTIENLDLVDVDLSVEGGLGSIYAGSQYNLSNSNGRAKTDTFDDEVMIDLGAGGASPTGLYVTRENAVTSGATGYDYIQNYRSVYNEFINFAEFNRKDHLFIADPLRNIFVQGENQKVLDFDKTRTFTQFVYWPLRHLYGHTNTSFAATYGNWCRVTSTLGKQVWSPFSGFAASMMANSDSTYAPWFAPAGFTRGRFAGVNDIAVIPQQKHRDQLYKININPVTQFPGEGFVSFGQKTMFKKPSAFDRINVRRLFLWLEKLVRKTMRFYVFEPNTLLTRTSVLNVLTPEFERVKNDQGMYDYLIICDERNNPPNVIDQNELVVDIYIKPVRAAEFVLVNFYATRTGQDFSELVS